MQAQRKPRSDSVEGQRLLQAALQKPIISPFPLEERETIIFEGLIDGLPRESWDKQSIRAAARLAKLEGYIEGLIDEVIEEGPVLINVRGTPVANPKQTAMTTTASTIKMMRTGLGLSASQRGIHKTTTAPKVEEERKARVALEAVGGDSLLA